MMFGLALIVFRISDIRLHSGSIIGAGSVVSHDAGHYKAFAGVAAKKSKFATNAKSICEIVKFLFIINRVVGSRLVEIAESVGINNLVFKPIF